MGDLSLYQKRKRKQQYYINQLHRSIKLLFDLMAMMRQDEDSAITSQVFFELSVKFREKLAKEEYKLQTLDEKIRACKSGLL